jgi:hypothetical protein
MLLLASVASVTGYVGGSGLASLHHCARVRQPTASAFDWQGLNPASRKLNLLPFGLDDLLLPGETKQIHLYEARFLELFTQADAEDCNCVGQLLVTPGGNAAAVSTLLEIEESRKQDVGVWARLKCVGRVRIDDLEPNDFGYFRAGVELVTDCAPAEALESNVDDCLEAHNTCKDLETKLRRLRATGGDGGAPLAPSAADRVEWGHEQHGLVGFDRSLQELRDSRREVLCSRGLDSAPASGLDGELQTLWGVDSEAAAEAQLLSFCASACLSTRERATALSETSTIERLQSATAALREKTRQLSAKVALAEAGGAL